MRPILRLAGVLLLIPGACTGGAPPDQIVDTDKSEAADTRLQYSLSVLPENMATTNLTARVRIEGVRLGEPPDDDEGEIDVLVHDVSVLQVYRGQYTDNMLSYEHYVARGDSTTQQSGQLLIVSLCLDSDGVYYLPDIGYEIPASRQVLSLARSLLDTKAVSSAGQACDNAG